MLLIKSTITVFVISIICSFVRLLLSGDFILSFITPLSSFCISMVNLDIKSSLHSISSGLLQSSSFSFVSFHSFSVLLIYSFLMSTIRFSKSIFIISLNLSINFHQEDFIFSVRVQESIKNPIKSSTLLISHE
ncbi:hypothetical protein HOG21_03940 [bacterium]|nr:hypothetical protein [bacterium]